MMRKFAAELLGTGLLVFFGVGVATLMFGFKFDGGSVAAGVVATALAFGLVLLALAYTLGPISGCHVNPAVTIGALLAGRMPLIEAAGLLGGPVRWRHPGRAAVVGDVQYLTPVQHVPDRARYGRLGGGAPSDIHIGAGGAFLAEVVLTALFVFVILGVTSRLGNAATAAMTIGLTLTVVHLIGIPITGTSVNPARSLGPALIVLGLDRAEPGLAFHRGPAGRRDRRRRGAFARLIPSPDQSRRPG